MTVTASGIVFRANQRPVASITAGGEFQLTLLAMCPTEGRVREPWRLIWTGPEAARWWKEHGPQSQPGDPLFVEAEHLRPHSFGRELSPEIHAHVRHMELRPHRWVAAPQKSRQTTRESAPHGA